MHHRQLRVAAAAEQRHHPVPDREAKRVRPGRGDLARALEPGDVLRRIAWRRVAAGALGEIGAVDAARPDADQDLPFAGDRVGALLATQLAA